MPRVCWREREDWGKRVGGGGDGGDHTHTQREREREREREGGGGGLCFSPRCAAFVFCREAMIE